MAIVPSPSTLNRLVERLGKELNASKAEIRAFVQHAVNLDASAGDERPFAEIVRKLLRQGLATGHVLAALLECEWASIQALIATHGKGGHEAPESPDFCRRQVAELTSCIQHYNHLQAVVVEEAEAVWSRTLADERMHRVLAEARVRWLRHRSIELHNYFMEIPVRVQLEVVDVVEDQIVAVYSPEAAMVFAAADDLRTAWASASEGLRLRIYGRERRGNRLYLTVDGVEPDIYARRRYVRIQLEEPAPVVVERQGKPNLEARIRDQSLHGMGLFLSATTPDETDKLLNVGERIQCHWKLNGHAMQTDGIVRWQAMGKHGLRAGVEMTLEAGVRHDFQNVLMKEQRMVIGRLHMLGLPSWLQPGT